MLPNVNIRFLASITGGKLYSRDSVIRDYKILVAKVKEIKFIIDYINAHPTQKLDILYFNNKPINQYNVDGVNKNPKEWKQHDEEIKLLGWDVKSDSTLFDSEDPRKVSERIYCGCNYRFESNFIGNAIMFLIEDQDKNLSRWFLLPDNTVLLYLSEGRKVLGHEYTEYGKYPGMQYPCVRFDVNGKIIPKTYK